MDTTLLNALRIAECLETEKDVLVSDYEEGDIVTDTQLFISGQLQQSQQLEKLLPSASIYYGSGKIDGRKKIDGLIGSGVIAAFVTAGIDKLLANYTSWSGQWGWVFLVIYILFVGYFFYSARLSLVEKKERLARKLQEEAQELEDRLFGT